MLQTATTTSRRLHDNDETDISESDEYDLEEESEVEGSEVLPLWRKKWEVPKYECIALRFQVVSEMDRAELKNSQ